MIIWYLIAMIILGILGAALSFYRKNHYLQVFDDILGEKKMKRSRHDWAGASFTDFSSRSILVCSFGALWLL